jgi:uncharacterized protein (TIGR02145 family)
MQYPTDDRIKLTVISGDYRMVITDVPLKSKTITFGFVACTDADGNNYSVKVIATTKGNEDFLSATGRKGGMTFMGENLKVTKLNDNAPIPMVTNNSELCQMTSPGYCWHINQTTYMYIPGAYYNWCTVNSGKLCQTGWHVPTQGEFLYLREIPGGSEEAGGKLKETGTAHWKSPNVGARNTTGITALPADYRDSNGSFTAMGSRVIWWSSSPSYVRCTIGAWYIYLYYNDKTLMMSKKCLSTTGYAVCCLKD